MIRFNGYPFLEKEDHALHTAVSSVMRTELQTLPASGLCVRDIGEPVCVTNREMRRLSAE